MKKTLMILGLGAAISMFGCSDDDNGGVAGAGGEGGEGGGMAGAGGEGGEGGGMGGMGGEGGTAGTPGQSGSTTWLAPTDPPGGGTDPTTGGCQVFVTILMADVFFDATLTLTVGLDEANNATTSWEFELQNPLLGALGGAADLGALDIKAVATGATGGPITSALTEDATGAAVGEYYAVPGVGPLLLSTPDAITAGTAALTADGGAGSMFNVNWDGLFTLDLTLAGDPLITVDESICTFTTQGTGVDFVAN